MVVGALADEDEHVSSFAAEMLGRLGDPGAVPALINAYNNDINWEKVTLALIEINDLCSVPLLVEILESDEWFLIKCYIADAIGGIGEKNPESSEISKAVPALIKGLKSEFPDYRSHTAKALGKIGGASAVPALIDLLKVEKDDRVLDFVAGALGKIGDQSAVPVLIEKLNDPRWMKEEKDEMLGCFAIALGEIGDPSAVPALADALFLVDWVDREIAAWALGEIGDASAVPDLIGAMKQETADVHQEIVGALGKIGDPSAVPALIEELDNPMHIDHGKVAQALGRIGEAALEPFNQLYLEGKVSHELAEIFYSELGKKCDEADFDKGTVAPPKKAPKNPDDMKQMLLKRISQRHRPKTQDRKPKTLKRGGAGG
jgi:HEAT repeat protein